MKLMPKLKNMTKEQLEAWEIELAKQEHRYNRKDAANKIKQGRGWMF